MKPRKLPPLGLFYYVGVAALLYLPILLLVIFSFNNSATLVFPLKGFTLQWYGALSQNRELLLSVRNSLLIGLGSSAVATLLGAMGALAVVRFRLPGQGIFTAISALPLVIPYVILGVSLLLLYREIGIPLSAPAAGLGHVIISTPYALLIIASRLVGFPDNLEEAAMDLGTSYWGALWRITLPICSPALLAAFMLCFTISFDEYSISSFLVGTDNTLPVYLYSQLRFPARLPIVVALAAILMVLTILVMVLSEWLRRMGQTPARKA